jgi:pimeloyl-[acyl-carrier protein] methyl ester esterase
MTPHRRALLALGAAFAATPAFADDAPTTQMFKDSRFLVKDRFSVEIVGKGPDLIFVPGLSSSRATWKATADRLKGRYRLHLLQLAGFAGEPSRANAAGDFMGPVMEAIDSYIVEQKFGPATYIGHSLGGTLGLSLAQKHPEHLNKLCVVDSVPFLAQVMGFPTVEAVKPMTAQMRRPMTPQVAAQMEQQVRMMVTAPADQETVLGWTRLSDGSMTGRAYAEDIELDLRPGLTAMKTPTTLIYPRSDAFGLKPEQMDAQYKMAFAGMPNLTMVPVDASRHFVMFDQPDRFAQALDAFLKS